MPLTAVQKKELVESYKQGLATASHVFVINYQGVTVPQVTELRESVRRGDSRYIVVKNRLVLRAIEDAALGSLKQHFEGPTAVAYGDGDPVALAKTLTEFAKTVPTLEFKAGLVEGRPLTAEEIQELAQLPSREELLAKLVYLLQSPISRFARVLAAVPRQLVVVLDQIRRKKEAQQ